VRISKQLLERIADHAAATYPDECCGLLVGQGDEVLAVEATRNAFAAESGDRFEIDPLDHVRVWEAARRAGRQILGCYHSHPDGQAAPSSIDRRLARSFGGPFGYLVVAIEDGYDCRVYSGRIERNGHIADAPLDLED